MDTETLNDRILREASPDETALRRLKVLVEEVRLEEWFETVDDTSYTLEDWIEALLFFDDWLERKGITERPVDTMLGYIHCCTVALAETLALPELVDLVRENLEQYGFDEVRLS